MKICNIRKNSCWPFTNERKDAIKQEVLALREERAECRDRGDRTWQ